MRFSRSLFAGFASAVLALGLTVTALSGCDDPAKDKSRATVTEPITTTTSQLAAASAVGQGAVKYTFDQSASKVSWAGSKVTGKHDGGFGAFQGTVDVVDGAPDKSKVDVQIEADSITSDTPKLTGHLKSPDFFDVKTHPKATFVSTEIKKGGDKGATHTVTGNLTIKGITKTVAFPATLNVTGDAATVDAQFAINRRDYSLNYAGMPNDLIRDDVLITLAIRAKKGS